MALEDDEHAGDGILDEALGAEADDQGSDAQGGEDAHQIHAQHAQGPDQARNGADELGQAAEQARHGTGVSALFGHQLQNGADDDADQPHEDHHSGGGDDLGNGCGIAAEQTAEGLGQLGTDRGPAALTQQGIPAGVHQQDQGQDQRQGQSDFLEVFHRMLPPNLV